MKRREFIKGALGGAIAGGALQACGGAETGGIGGESAAVQTRPRVNWRLASSFPRGLDTIFGAAETLAARVEILSEGRFKIRVYSEGELVPGLQVSGRGTAGHGASRSHRELLLQGKEPGPRFRHRDALRTHFAAAECMALRRRRPRADARALRGLQHHQLPRWQHRYPDGRLVQQRGSHPRRHARSKNADSRTPVATS